MRRFFASLLVRFLLLILLTVLPSLGVMGTTLVQERDRALDNARDQALGIARVASGTQDQLIISTRQLLNLLAIVPAVQQNNLTECRILLENLLREYPAYANLAVTTADGDVWCSGRPLTERINLADRLYIREAIRTRAFAVGEYQIGRLSGRSTVGFGYPVIGDDGAIKGVVVASLDLAWLNTLAAQSQLPEGSMLLVLDQRGTILVRYPSPEEWIGKPGPQDQRVQELLTQQSEGTLTLEGVDGVTRLYAFTPLTSSYDGLHVLVGIGIPNSVAFASVNKALEQGLIILGLVAVFAISTAWLGGNLLLVRPVRRLVATAVQLSAGNLRARTDLAHSGNELGQLARTFDSMAESLERREDELRAAERRATETYFLGLLDITNDAIVSVDAARRIVLFNQCAEAVFGCEASSVLGQPIDALLPLSADDLAGGHSGDLTCVRADGRSFPAAVSVSSSLRSGEQLYTLVLRDMSEHQRAEQERDRLIADLQEAITNIKTLHGLLPICASCKKIRDDHGYWNQIEMYIREHADVQFTHGICPPCFKKLYPDIHAEVLAAEPSSDQGAAQAIDDAGASPDLMGAALQAWMSYGNATIEDLADYLGCRVTDLERLADVPRPRLHAWFEDLEIIAASTGIDHLALEALLEDLADRNERAEGQDN